MKNTSRFIKPLVILGMFLVFLPRAVMAYLDPGTGSYILQLALAVMLGSLFAIKLFWSRIKSFLKKTFTRGKKQ